MPTVVAVGFGLFEVEDSKLGYSYYVADPIYFYYYYYFEF